MALASDDYKSLRKIAEALVAKAMEGDMAAISEVANRLDGKPLQAVEIGEPGDFEALSDADLMAEVEREAAELGVPVTETAH